MRSSSIYLSLLVISTAVALVPALNPALDLAVAGFFLQPNPPVHPADWWWIDLINEYVPALFRTLVVLSWLAWIFSGRSVWLKRHVQTFAFVALAGLIGPGLLVGALKDTTLRARPFHVTEFGGTRQFHPPLALANQCDDNCAFVSGHTSDGFFFVTLMLIDPRRRKRWITIGLCAGLIIGFARVSVGAHWLTDVLWALPVTLIGSWIAWAILSRWYPEKPLSI